MGSTVGMVENGRDRSGNYLKMVSSDLGISYIKGTAGSAVMSLGQWENSGTISRMEKSWGRAHQRRKIMSPGPGSVLDTAVCSAIQALCHHRCFFHSLSYCIRQLLLHNKLSQNLSIMKQPPFIISHNF